MFGSPWLHRAAPCLLAATLASHGAAAPSSAPAAPRIAAILPPNALRRDQSVPIQHVIIIMQENRSFDSYFGTFPGANGIPPGTCIPLRPTQPGQGCVTPFHDPHDVNTGGPHSAPAAKTDADNGITTQAMDGFVYEQTLGLAKNCGASPGGGVADCGIATPGANRHDAAGYHTDAEIPNYWAYAEHFVLQDSLFEGVRNSSLPSHLDLTSEWSALCTQPGVLSSCTTSLAPVPPSGTKIVYPWVNLFQLLDANSISWKYYLGVGTEPDCEDDEMTCAPQRQTAGVLSLWNPVPGFASVEAQGASYLAAHNPPLDQFLVDVAQGTLPQVAWIVPSNTYSEHPTNGVTAGMEYVTSLVNAVMQSPYWNNTAVFIAWDDWGGFYDHVVPPIVDRNSTTSAPVQGFGFRVPGLMISAYARPGYIDHSVLSMDSYATFIEDVFMNGTRLDPVAMGQPDNRPDIRDALTSVTFPNGDTMPIGSLMDEFDFTQAPLNPLVLSTHIPTGIILSCASTDANNPQHCGSAMVRVSWRPVASGAVPGVFTYQVLRDGAAVAGCSVTKAVCIDASAPSGVHMYTVDSTDAGGVVSPASAAAEADVP